MLNNKALAALILGADEAALTAMANKGLYKRAVKDIDGAEPLYTEDDEGASVSVGGEVCKIKVPLEKSDRAGAEFQRPVSGGYSYLASNPLGGLVSSGGYPALLRLSSVRVRHAVV